MEPLSIAIGERGVARVTLCRPQVHNAFDAALIEALTDGFARLGEDSAVRLVVLAAEGRSFSAGADLEWMRAAALQDEAANVADARRLGLMLRAIERCPKPTVARVQGAALGGGVGLVAACDIAIAADTAVFALSEVRLGLIPSMIGPHVMTSIGERACRRLFLTGERFSAAHAKAIGLVHDVIPAERLDAAVDGVVEDLLAGAAGAQSAAKDLIRAIRGRPLDDALLDETAQRIAAARASDEGREGMAAFLERRRPSWADRRDVP